MIKEVKALMSNDEKNDVLNCVLLAVRWRFSGSQEQTGLLISSGRFPSWVLSSECHLVFENGEHPALLHALTR